MKSFVKRILSSTVAAAMLLTSAAFPTIASAADISYLYADLYGVDIVMSEAVGDATTHIVSVTDSTGANVDFNLMAMQEGETLATDVLSVNFASPIELDEIYTITVDGASKSFRVTEYTSLDFDDYDAETAIENTTNLTGTNGVEWKRSVWSAGASVNMITDNADFGASATNKKLVMSVRDSQMFLASDMPTTDATIYADVELYNTDNNDFFLFGRGFARNDSHNLSVYKTGVQSKQANAYNIKPVTDGLVNTDTNTYFDTNGNYIKGSGGDPVYDYYVSQWNGRVDMNLGVTTTDADGNTTTSYPAARGAAYDDNSTDVAGTMSLTLNESGTSLAEQLSYEKTAKPTTVRAAARVYDATTADSEAGYYGGFAGVADAKTFNYTGTSYDETTRLTSGSPKRMGMSSNNTGVKVIDNILITTCDVGDSSVAVPELVNYYADLYGVDLVYAADPTEAVNALALNPVLMDANGNVVPSTLYTNADSKVVSVVADEMLELDTIYQVNANGTTKKFYVESIFEEDFEDIDAQSTYYTSTQTLTSDTGITWTMPGNGKGTNSAGVSWVAGTFVTDSMLGATATDKHLILRGDSKSLVIKNTNPKITFYATSKKYKDGNTNSNSVVGMMTRSGGAKQNSHLMQADASSAKHVIRIADYTCTNNANGTPTSYSATASGSGTILGEATLVESYDDASVTSLTETTAASEVRLAMRSYDFDFGNGNDTATSDKGYYGGFAGYVGGEMTYSGTGYDNGTFITCSNDSHNSGWTYVGMHSYAYGLQVVDDVMITTCVELDASRDPAVVESIYGDAYGMDVTFSAEPLAVEYNDLAVTDANGNEVEIAATKVTDTVLTVSYAEKIETGAFYNITVAGENYDFVVVEVFNEDFNNVGAEVDAAALATISGNGWTAYNAFITDDERWGASESNKMLGIHDNTNYSEFQTGALTSRNSVTVSAKIMQYVNGCINIPASSAGGFWPSTTLTYGDGYRIQSIRDRFEIQNVASSAYTKIYQGESVRTPVNWYDATKAEGSRVIADISTLAVGRIGDGLTRADYPYTQKYKGVVDQANNTVTASTELEDVTIAKPTVIDNVAMRINNNKKLTVLTNKTDSYNGDPLTVAVNNYSTTGKLNPLPTSGESVLTNAALKFEGAANVVTLLDDILVTTFDYFEKGERDAAQIVGDPYADIYGVDVEFDKTPYASEYAATILDENKNEVEFTTVVEEVSADVAVTNEDGSTVTTTNDSYDSSANKSTTNLPYKATTQSQTRYIVHYNFTSPIERDTAYRITIGDKLDNYFTAKTVVFEDFDALDYATTAVNNTFLQGSSQGDANSKDDSGAYKVRGTDWYAAVHNDSGNTYAGAWIADTALGSEAGNKKLAIFGKSTALKSANNNAIPLNSTVSADIQSYYTGYNDSMVGYLLSHGTGKSTAYSMTLNKADGFIGWAHYGNSLIHTPGQVTGTKGGTVAYATSPVGTLNQANTTGGVFEPTDSVATAATPVTSVVRAYDNVLAGFVAQNNEVKFAGSMLDTSDAQLLSTQTPGQLRNAHGFGIESRGNIMVIDNLLVTESVIENAKEANITGVYADIYGVEVAVDDIPAKTQLEGFVVENSRGAAVELTAEYDADLGVIRATFEEPIKTDLAYKLTIGEGYANKGFIVNKVFDENFNDITENVDPESLATITEDAWTASNAVITADSKWGATSADKKLLLHNGARFYPTNAVNGKKATVSAKVDNYINYKIGTSIAGQFWIQNEWLWFGSGDNNSAIKLRQQRDCNFLYGADGNKISSVTGLDRISYGVSADNKVPTEIDSTTGYYVKPSSTALGLIGNGYGVADYPYVKQQKMTLTTTTTADDGTTTTTWAPAVVADEYIDISTNPVTSPKVTSNVAMRITGDAISIFADFTGNGTPAYKYGAILPEEAAPTADTNKFGYRTTETVAVVDDFVVTTCTLQDTFEATGPVEIKVTDIYGKADGVYVEFDETLEATDNFEEIEVYENGTAVDTTATVNGNVVKLAVDGGIESGAIYRVVVPAKYQPNDDLVVNTEATKNFKLTIYADEDFADEDLAVTVTGGSADNAVAKVIDGKLVLRGGEVTLDSVANAANYNVSFDATVYTTAITDANDSEDQMAYYYKETPTGIKMWYNGGTDKANGYEWAIGSTSLTKKVYSASGIDSGDETVSYDAIEFGDALYADSEFTTFANGDSFDDYEFALSEVEDLSNSENPVTTSQRSAAQYTVAVEKIGKKATYSLNGAVVSSFDGTENADGASEGIFGVSASVEEFVVIDNIYAYSYEEIKDIAVELTADGKVEVTNVSSTSKPVVVVVATYDSNNRMIDAWVSTITNVDGFNTASEEYAVDATEAVKTKAFVWDNMTSLIPYCTPAQIGL